QGVRAHRRGRRREGARGGTHGERLRERAGRGGPGSAQRPGGAREGTVRLSARIGAAGGAGGGTGKGVRAPRGSLCGALLRARPSQSGLGMGPDPRRHPVCGFGPAGRDPLKRAPRSRPQSLGLAAFLAFARCSTAASTASRRESLLAGDLSATPHVLRASATSWRDALLSTGRITGPEGPAAICFSTVRASAMSTSTTLGPLSFTILENSSTEAATAGW